MTNIQLYKPRTELVVPEIVVPAVMVQINIWKVILKAMAIAIIIWITFYTIFFWSWVIIVG